MIQEVDIEAFASRESEVSPTVEFAPLWRELETRAFDSLDFVIHETARGEVAQFTSVTNAGKTTLLLNAAISLACGRSFPPLIAYSGNPRRVLFLDFESRQERLFQDIRGMAASLAENERTLLGKNLAVACDVEFDDEPMSLSDPMHMKSVALRAKELQCDVIIIDTAAAAFDLNNENDNAEVSRRLQKPLKQLARMTDAVVCYSHHIGKAGEQGAARESRAYRGRGASAYGCFARSVFNLEPDTRNPSCVILVCAKVKGEPFRDVVLRLNPEARWFSVTDETAPKTQTGYELVMAVIAKAGRPIGRAELEAELEGRVAKTSVTRTISEALKRRDIIKIKHGLYALTTNAQMLTPISNEHLGISGNGREP